MKSAPMIAEEAVERILSARVQGPRASTYRMTFLNRSPRTLRAIRRRHDKACRKIGMDDVSIGRQWADVEELAELEERAD